jgi:hypothetical protein
MKLEDAGSLRWGPECIRCWPPFVSLRPLLYFLYTALTRLVGFTLEH